MSVFIKAPRGSKGASPPPTLRNKKKGKRDNSLNSKVLSRSRSNSKSSGSSSEEEVKVGTRGKVIRVKKQKPLKISTNYHKFVQILKKEHLRQYVDEKSKKINLQKIQTSFGNINELRTQKKIQNLVELVCGHF